MDLSGGIDPNDPIAFAVVPDGTELLIGSEEDDSYYNMFSTIQSDESFPSPGIQWRDGNKESKTPLWF